MHGVFELWYVELGFGGYVGHGFRCQVLCGVVDGGLGMLACHRGNCGSALPPSSYNLFFFLLRGRPLDFVRRPKHTLVIETKNPRLGRRKNSIMGHHFEA